MLKLLICSQMSPQPQSNGISSGLEEQEDPDWEVGFCVYVFEAVPM